MTNMDELSKKSVWEKYSDKLVSKIFSPYFDDMKSENLYSRLILFNISIVLKLIS